MKISSFSIKNFKSIDELENFTPNDNQIVCFIGKNGSGKSNILSALSSLKNDDELVDSNRYEKTDKEDLIKISADILFNNSDSDLLNSLGLNLSEIQGFHIEVNKKINEDAIRNFTPIGYSDKTNEKLKKTSSKILSVIKRSKSFEQEEIDSFVEKLKLESDFNKEEFKKTVEQIKNTVAAKLTEQEEIRKEIELLFGNLNQTIDFDIKQTIENEIWLKLMIVLLNPETYIVENSCQIEELNNADKHTFLYDLFCLSEKLPSEMNVNGSDLDNISNDISTLISENLSNVWDSHKLFIKIAKQANNLIFMFKTPQDRSLELTNLSDGQQWFLRFYTALITSKQKGQKVIWLFDEPGQTLHASSQINLKKFFEDISEDSQLFYTTHQPMMIPWNRLERIYLAENQVESGTKIPERLWKDSDVESPLRESLALFVGEELLTGTQHVLVEGISDYIYLQGWLRFFLNTREARWFENYSISDRNFVPTGGYGSMPLYLLFLMRNSKEKISAVAIPDRTTDETEVKKVVANLQKLAPEKGILSFESILNKDGKLPIFGIEDIFDVDEFLNETREYYSLKYPDVKLPDDFTKPKSSKLKNGICRYIKNVLEEHNKDLFNESNKSFDKPGVAFHIYKKLIKVEKTPFRKDTEKRFEEILKKINSEFDN